MQNNKSNNLKDDGSLKKSQHNTQKKGVDWLLGGDDELDAGIMGLIDKGETKKKPNPNIRIDYHD